MNYKEEDSLLKIHDSWYELEEKINERSKYE